MMADLDRVDFPAGTSAELAGQLKQALASALRQSGATRFAMSAPTSAASRVRDLRMWATAQGATCRWTYRNQGDYNNDSQVALSDLMPLGAHFGRQSGDPDWVAARTADGDGNGQVLLTDVTPIGQNFLSTVDGYSLEVSNTPDPQGTWEDVAEVPFSASVVPPVGGPRQFNYELDSPEVGRHYRVVPYDGTEEGAAGEPCLYSGAQEPLFEVSGACRDAAGAPLADVQVALSEHAAATTDAAGGYSFDSVADGFSGKLTPQAAGLIFLPRERLVCMDNTPSPGQDFRGFAANALQTTLPANGFADDDVQFELRAVDALGSPLAGFTTGAELSSSPGGMTITTPAYFQDGVATAVVHFTSPGTYSVSVSGLGGPLDGEIGHVVISTLPPPELHLEKWHGGAEAALSLTFDDASPVHWSRGLPLWKDYGFHVTLGILAQAFTSDPSRLPQLQEAFDAGHELANHTTSHSDLTTFSDDQIRADLATCKKLILDNVRGLNLVLSVAYPYETFDDRVTGVLASEGYLFARSGPQGIIEYAPQNDPYNPAFLHLYSWANVNNLPMWMWDATTDRVMYYGGWMIEQCHGIGVAGEPGVGWSPRPESEFRAHYDHIKSYGGRLWVAPMGVVGSYILRRNQAQFTILKYTRRELDFELTDPWGSTLFAVPLTVAMPMPPLWTGASASQNGTPLEVAVDDQQTIRIDVLSGGGDVSVVRE